MEDEGDEGNGANSEMRYISLELMKLAQKSGKSFEQVASEYMENTARLQEMIIGEEEVPARRGKALKTRQQK